MQILMLGGTGWLGGETVGEALRRGHEVTCLARGTRPAPEGARLVRADRDDPQPLAPVAGRTWDAVLDVTDQPGRVREAVRSLRAGHWVYVSSASVYAEGREVDRSEDEVQIPLPGRTDGVWHGKVTGVGHGQAFMTVSTSGRSALAPASASS